MQEKNLLTAQKCAAEMNVPLSSFQNLAGSLGYKLYINQSDFDTIRSEIKEPTRCNISYFDNENSKKIGDSVEKDIKKALELDAAYNTHHDATKDKKRVEVKTITALDQEQKTNSFISRALSISKHGTKKLNTSIFQHIKPNEFDILIGIVVYMDGALIYIIKTAEINPSTLEKDRNEHQITMGQQQKGHPTEGTLRVKDLHLVATIKGLQIVDIDIPFNKLLEVLKNNIQIEKNSTETIRRSNEINYELLSF